MLSLAHVFSDVIRIAVPLMALQMQRMETSASFAGQKYGRTSSVLFVVLFFLFGVWVGFSNEQLFAAAATLAFLWLAFVLWKRLGKSVPAYLYLGITGLMAGGIIQMVSPGNYHRVSVRGTGMKPKLNQFMRFFYEVYVRVGVRLSAVFAVLLLIFVPVLIIALIFNRRKKYGHGKNQDEGSRGNTADNFQISFCLAMVLASLASIAPFVLLSDFAAIRLPFSPHVHGACCRYYCKISAGKAERIRLLQARIGGSPVHHNHTVCRWGQVIRNARLISDEFALREKIIENIKQARVQGDGGSSH